MQLNPDCIRDLLLTVEENADHSHTMDYPADPPIEYKALASYSKDLVLYHIRQCLLSGLFTQVLCHSEGCMISELSKKGHAFIANIRSDTNWEKTKSIAQEAGSWSLNTLSQIATSVISDALLGRLSQYK